MLPVLGLLLVGTIFVGRLYLAHQRALVEARRCAFAYAVLGCDRLPKGCDGLAHWTQRDDGRNKGKAIVEQAQSHISGPFDVFERVPVIGEALKSLFGTTARAEVPIELRMPWTAKDSVHSSVIVALTCNEREHDVTSDIEDAISKLVLK